MRRLKALASASIGALIIFGGIFSGSAIAAETEAVGEIEEVIVTATKRTENLRDVPMTISVLGQSDIEVQGINDAQDIARRVPGLTHSQAGKNLVPHYQLRGIAVSNNPENVNTPVSTYLDDFPITSSNSSTNPEPNLFDVQRVEVLKGPQGTLYGSGTLGGIVRVVTNKADPSAFDYAISTDFGSTDGSLRQRYNGMVNIPVADNAAIRLVGYIRDEEGWINNTGTGVDNADNLEESGIRLSARWDASDKLTATFNYVYQESNPEDVALSFSPDNVGVSTSFKPQFSNTELTATNLTIEYDLGFAELTSSTNLFDTSTSQENDLSGILAAAPFKFPWGMIRSDEHENTIQELRLVSTGDDALSWVVGYYYADRDTDYGQVHHTTADIVSSRSLAGLVSHSLVDHVFIDAAKRVNTDKETAFFGEIGYQLTDDLKLSVGARTGDVEVSDTRFAQGFDGLGAMIQTNLRWFMGQVGAMPQLDSYVLGETVPPAKRPFGALQDDGTYANETWATEDSYSTFKVSLGWQAQENVNIYGLAAKGFRGPQINGAATANGGVSSVDPNDIVIAPSSKSDSLMNYEVGMKARWMDGRVDTNLTAYFIDWSDIQQQVRRVSDAGSFITNAGGAETKGIEVEVRAMPNSQLDLGINLSIQDSKITELSDAEAALTGFLLGTSEDLSAPDFSASGYAQYTMPVMDGQELYFRTDIQHVGAFPNKSMFTTGQPGTVDPNYEKTDSYQNVNISVGLTSEKWGATLYGENMLDNDNITYIFPNIFLGSRYGTLRPRTIGLRLAYRL